MVDSLPSSIELTPVQREIIDLIIQDQATIQGPVEPERAILLWSDGISESVTAQRLGISEESVRTLRCRWWESTGRIAAAEKKLHKVFNDLVSLIFRIPNEVAPSETALNSSAARIQAFKQAAPTKGNQQNTKNYELRQKRLLKSSTTNQRFTGSTESTGP
jgi:hypothetical protein